MKILYNREVILIKDFMKVEKFKKKVFSFKKIQIIDYKPWQVLRFKIIEL